MARGRQFAGVLAACFALAALVPALAAAGSISGTVTAEGGGPIQGVEVCATPSPEAFETACAETNASGQYSLPNLPESNYRVRFSGERNNLKYVTEAYDNAKFWKGDLFHLAALQNATLDAELEEGGSISGTTTDEESGEPIADVFACARESEGFEIRCARSNANGEYVLNGLPSDVYTVVYESFNQVNNYLKEFYEDAATWAAATEITVTAPATTAGIDAELTKGAEILGTVRDVKTGAPLEGILVCALEPEPGEYQDCDWSGPAGAYAIRGLPADTYLVAFQLEYGPFGVTADQWWQGASSAEEATPIAIAPPESRTGIDGYVTSPYWTPPPEPEGGATDPGVTPPPPPVVAKKPLPKCKKGFHRKWVKGKKRCVRKHKAHRHKRR
ncbi:MAG: carboxypeptidase-like regulatory domain-containing protein [Actinomycetota bacterium]|nr:carboxypeptidase-like regulatory domain-containing protein [Actinomycetota bacterium]